MQEFSYFYRKNLSTREVSFPETGAKNCASAGLPGIRNDGMVGGCTGRRSLPGSAPKILELTALAQVQ
jgi:hypothetical protein